MSATASTSRRVWSDPQALRSLRLDPTTVLTPLIVVGLMLLWAWHDGGFDLDTWYWGGLLCVFLLAVSVVRRRPARRLAPAAKAAIGFLVAYAVWSYVSISWAGSPGDAWNGANKTLTYLAIFALFTVLPWNGRLALGAMLIYTVGVGAMAVDVMIRLHSTSGAHVVIDAHRLFAPTGYFNSSAALFTIGALLATVLASRREIPVLLRGLLVAIACTCLQVAFLAESRGWLFTLPVVVVLSLVVARGWLRVAMLAILPAASVLVFLHALEAIYQTSGTPVFSQTARHASNIGLATFLVALVAGSVLCWADRFVPEPQLSASVRRLLNTGLIIAIAGVAALGAFAGTQGHPVSFIKREWHGFIDQETSTTGAASYFETMGSGRYDFWRVALDAFKAHPVGGLGQDNFLDYYIPKRNTYEQPSYPHSLEMRLLACTGAVGALLFLGFLVFALRCAGRAIWPRGPAADPLAAVAAGAALLPLIDWVCHGSVDWFWEIPALSGPAFGFLGVAVALGSRQAATDNPSSRPPEGISRALRLRRLQPGLLAPSGLALLVGATVALGLPYLAVRELSLASDLRSTNPQQALSNLRLAGKLDPLWAEPGRLGGTIALQVERYPAAVSAFEQAVRREPGGWFAWYGLGLAETQMGDPPAARAAFRRAVAIDRKSPALGQALARVETTNPVGVAEGLTAISGGTP